MDNNITDVAATLAGAAFPGARSAWASVAGVGATYVRTQNPALAAEQPDARCAAFRHVPASAPTMLLAAMNLEPQNVLVRKQPNAQMTRIGAGNGAMGSPPEREPAY